MLKQITLFLLVTIASVTLSYAEKASPEVTAVITSKLSAARPDLSFGSVETTLIENLYLVRVNGTQFLYVNKTGDYILDGNMFQARPGMFVPVKDLEAANIRRELMASINIDDTIVFPAVAETKAVVYVFTDVDCGYCRKLHNEVLPDLTLNGVEVRYLAYPRAGLGSSSYRKIASAWCADDKQAALTALKTGQTIEDNVCKDNPVAEQYAMGQKAGVTGTPALVLEDGTLLPGYRPVNELLKILGLSES